jgi:hypothetical protein
VTLALCDTKLEGLELANFELTLFDRDIWSGNTTFTLAFKAVTIS